MRELEKRLICRPVVENHPIELRWRGATNQFHVFRSVTRYYYSIYLEGEILFIIPRIRIGGESYLKVENKKKLSSVRR